MADPPGNRRPPQLHLLLLELKEQKAGCGQNGAGEKEPGSQDEGDTVLGALKTDEGDSGEDEGEQAGSDLEITLQNGVGLKGHKAEPHGEEQEDDKSSDTRQDGSDATAVGALNQSGLGHSVFFDCGPGRLSN